MIMNIHVYDKGLPKSLTAQLANWCVTGLYAKHWIASLCLKNKDQINIHFKQDICLWNTMSSAAKSLKKLFLA